MDEGFAAVCACLMWSSLSLSLSLSISLSLSRARTRTLSLSLALSPHPRRAHFHAAGGWQVEDCVHCLWSVDIKVSEHELATDFHPPSESACARARETSFIENQERGENQFTVYWDRSANLVFKKTLRAEGWRVQPAVE